jgi:ABC-2 type transport system ATP-binding protein
VRAARAAATAVVDRLGLTDAADRLARTYSGGMRRKLDLGASLVGSPRLLLLDEPTTGLDPRSRIELWDAIRELVERGTDVLLTTQYLDEADHLASRIVIIDHGRAVAAGTPQELKQRAGRSVIEVHVRDRADLSRAAAALARLDHGEPQVEEATRRVSVAVEAGTDRLRDALAALDSAAVAAVDVSLRAPKLDEVFLALTGQSLDETADPAADPAA